MTGDVCDTTQAGVNNRALIEKLRAERDVALAQLDRLIEERDAARKDAECLIGPNFTRVLERRLSETLDAAVVAEREACARVALQYVSSGAAGCIVRDIRARGPAAPVVDDLVPGVLLDLATSDLKDAREGRDRYAARVQELEARQDEMRRILK